MVIALLLGFQRGRQADGAGGSLPQLRRQRCVMHRQLHFLRLHLLKVLLQTVQPDSPGGQRQQQRDQTDIFQRP